MNRGKEGQYLELHSNSTGMNCSNAIAGVAATRASWNMKKSDLLHALQSEIRRHRFDTFLGEKPSMANGGGVAIPGCSACQKRINTMAQFLDPLADDVLPGVVERLHSSVS